jgi:hypothetical protein
LERGVPDEAFATLPGDDKETAAVFRKRNKKERAEEKAGQTRLAPDLEKELEQLLRRGQEIHRLPERTPGEIEAKKRRYEAFTQSQEAWHLGQIAAIPLAQFYLPKTVENRAKLITDADFQLYRTGARSPQGQATAAAWDVGLSKRFFHWFLEFPEIIEKGGFDCILGNPPYLGGTYLSGTYGYPFCQYVKWEYAPTGLSDLVTYFVRRIFDLVSPNGYTAFITTNSIRDGDIRADGLDQILKNCGAISMAVTGTKWPGRANLVVSIISICNGELPTKPILDGRPVEFISAFLDDERSSGPPLGLQENKGQIMVGSEWGGSYFLVEPETARHVLGEAPRCMDVIRPIINGDELNSHPMQLASRYATYFADWSREKSETYTQAYSLLEKQRLAIEVEGDKAKPRIDWWRFRRPTVEMYSRINGLSRCFVIARVTKYLNISSVSTNTVFAETIKIFTTDRWDLYAVVQSTLHEVWARKYSGALKQDLRYSPSKCFNTFPFPTGQWRTPNPSLAAAGERYHEHRRALMLQLWLGLTDVYNLFHTRDLTPAQVAKVSKKPVDVAEAGYQGILDLRRLHRELDLAVRDAYDWSDLDLGHDFHDVETLPENDRVRYTISPEARKEVLRRLLALNHQRAAAEKDEAPAKPAKRGRKPKKSERQGEMFG